ncbi:MAG: UDP-N-acetylmuramoyl-L-alanine--D-glutamate ligase [Candidatus Omnitrophica bacterium]|nr:UDP-N-acetylmuramoyl-L-alanine--D-glutamate ligase [Candidatus Omnitrophota bacterium]
MNIQGKKIAVLGLGESGLQTALFLKKHDALPFVSEREDTDGIKKRKELLDREGISCEIGTHSIQKIIDSAFVIISPGISPRTPICQMLHKEQVEVLSEIELACRFFSGDIIAVTGTDGKTTVTTLIQELLTGFGLQAISCGNIGNPFIGELDTITSNTKVVLEVSSFQLYRIKQFKPMVAVLLNVAPDHLDWHYNFNDYLDAKMKLFANQTSKDYAILNFNDKETQNFLCRINSRQLFFNQFPSDMDANREAALLICDVYGLDKRKGKQIVRNFPGLEHRMEFVPSGDGIRYINDSKSTSLHSLEWALDLMEKKVILICGGRNKGLDFSLAQHIVKEKVKCAVVFGESKEDIRAAWKDCVPCTCASTLPEVLTLAQHHAEENDTILFSPACTSFDMFLNYKERGTVFKQLVNKAKICGTE